MIISRTVRLVSHRRMLRAQVYERSGGVCELRHRPDCVEGVLSLAGTRPEDHGYLVAVRGTFPWPKRVKVLLTLGARAYAWGCWRCVLLGPLGRGLMMKETPQTVHWSNEYYGN